MIKKRLRKKKGKRRWEYLTYATNVERWYIKRTMKDVPEEYKKRWRIENNFKSVEQMRARTCSRNHAIRVFMFFLSISRWKCTQNLTDCIPKLGKLDGTK